MRVAAAVILLAVGAVFVSYSLPSLLSQLLRSVTIYVAVAIAGLLIGAGAIAGGISAVLKRRFWLSVSGAIGLLLVAAAATALTGRLAWYALAPFWVGCGVPGILALVFLAKRRVEFRS